MKTILDYDSIQQGLDDYVVPEGIEIIKSNTFGQNSKEKLALLLSGQRCIPEHEIENIVLPKSLKTVEYGAFNSSRRAKNVYYNGTIEDWCKIKFEYEENRNGYHETPSQIFYFADSKLFLLDNNGDVSYNGKKYSLVTEIVIPKTIKEVGPGRFQNLCNIKKIIIPDGVEIIGAAAFSSIYSYTSLESIEIGDSVKIIDELAFSGCSGKITNFKMSKNLKKIGYMAFSSDDYDANFNNIPIMEIAFSEGIEEIGDRAFEGNLNLKSVVIPDGVKELKSSFANCKNLVSAKLPDSVVLMERTFSGCRKLKEVNIPKKLEEINDGCFACCNEIKELSFHDSLKKIGKRVFYQCEGLIDVVLPNSMKEISAEAFFECSNLKSIIIPNGVKEIEESTFESCKKLKVIKLPDGLEKIGEAAFRSCKSLEDIIIPDSVTEIEKKAFSGCSKIKCIKLPKGLKTIDNHLFSHCGSLEYIVISEGTKKMLTGAFGYCNILQKVYYEGKIEKWDKINIGKDNEPIKSAILYGYSDKKPTEKGLYWHYDKDGKIVEW